MNHKKNFAAVLAVLMAVQNSGQPWAVLAYSDDTDLNGVITEDGETVITEDVSRILYPSKRRMLRLLMMRPPTTTKKKYRNRQKKHRLPQNPHSRI